MFNSIGPIYPSAGASGGSSSTPTLQQVTMAGNTTTLGMRVDGVISALGGIVQINNHMYVLSSGNPVIDLNAGGNNMNLFNFTAFTGFSFFANNFGSGGPGFNMFSASGSQVLRQICSALVAGTGGTMSIDWRFKGGTPALLSDLAHGTYTATVSGVSIVIPHGLPYTPTYANVVAKNAGARTIFLAGYFLSYTSTNIIMSLTASVLSTAVSIDWSALQ